ncbi:acetyl/propionyl-CoA carboxylase subunit alpha [Actinoallomurus purpureus]|uniref:ATP-binding protein n=1 Tax=Actinoallomurus purpureus TaxID=478114 RepID=UPI002093CB0C|nr:biotin carboxylase N-terminal domain-containing protein [Actinoallomurus purpureus]MCO6010761.1 acetyl/propionyl-CoA carboxylase subunit alpha [Actinoallomurus purpureus]
MFNAVLIANRGEIACRIIRTLRRLEIRSIVTYTDADADARHVREADAALRVNSYLDIMDVVGAALETGAEAVHPGYGFLAENPELAQACADYGIVFVGPPPDAIAAMGDKIRAKRTVAAAGVPVVPGRDEPELSDDGLAAAAMEIGLNAGATVLLKPSAGGGGKGMRRVQDPGELREAIAAARREARGAFGDDTLLVERYIDNPRHIEIQVFADAHGNAVHLGERECSLQRRHQKIVEEAPSPLLGTGPEGEAIRAAMGASAVAAARSVGYVGAGTVEYIVSADRPDEYFFMEMNTRLQVEHPVTEGAVTIDARPGLDLVELQLRVAAGEPLPFGQDAVAFAGHAVEARVYAEDPARGFLPTGGRVLRLDEPEGPDVRVDSGLVEGTVVGGSYDPMLAKVIARGPDRATALRRLDRALASYTLLGVGTNVAFLRSLLADPDVVAGRLDTGLVERRPAEPADAEVPHDVLAAAALERVLALEVPDPGPWDIRDGWRVGEPAWTTWRIAGREVRIRGRALDAEVSVDGGKPMRVAARRDGADLLVVDIGGRTRFACARDGDVCWLGRDGRVWSLKETEPLAARATETTASAGAVRSPMPGTVAAVKAADGDEVAAGQALVIVEAMKMEHTVTAPVDGVVSGLTVQPGAQVALDEVLAVVTPKGDH